MKYKFALINATGGKKERDALKAKGNPAGTALILVNDTLCRNAELDGLLVNGISDHQMQTVDSYMAARGYYKIMHEDYANQKQAWRNTCLTLAYVKRGLTPVAIRYNNERDNLKYRYVAFSLPDGLTVRTMHVPTDEVFDKNSTENRKQSMLLFEEELETTSSGAEIVLGDFNTEPGGDDAYNEIFDRLPYDKNLNEVTWANKKLDNVLTSPGVNVSVYTDDFCLGITSDHKTVICEVG